jgi:PAS domain-containing protein
VGEAKEGMERILASIQDAFIAFDSRFRFTFVNDNAALLCGAEKDGTSLSTHQLKRSLNLV